MQRQGPWCAEGMGGGLLTTLPGDVCRLRIHQREQLVAECAIGIALAAARALAARSAHEERRRHPGIGVGWAHRERLLHRRQLLP